MKNTYIIIHDIGGEQATSYIAYSRADCKDDTDRSAYDACCEHGEVITMGMVIAEPVSSCLA